MSIDFDELGLTPKEFTILARTSITKLRAQEDLMVSAERDVKNILAEIEDSVDGSAVEWLRTPLSDDVPMTPLQAWKHHPNLSCLLSDPVKALDDCCPEWKFLVFSGVNKSKSKNPKLGR